MVSIPVADNRLTVVQIHRDELVVIAAPNHPLSKLKSKSRRCPMWSSSLYFSPVSAVPATPSKSYCQERKLKPNISMELDSSELLKRFVAADVGVGIHRPLQCPGRRKSGRAGRCPAVRRADQARPRACFPQR